MIRRFSFLNSLALLLLFFTRVAAPQNASTGSIVGTVRDPSGAGVPNASIELIGAATGLRLQTLTSGEGTYNFPQVPPGDYQIRITAPSFQVSVLNIKVNIAQSALGDAQLVVGQTSQTVEVNANVAQAELQTTNASIGDVLQHQEIQALPTTQRQITELVYLQPATTPLVGGGEGSVGGGSVAGGRVDQNNLTLDGIIITDQAEGGYLVSGTISSFGIPEDAIQEFRGTVSNPSEDQARSGGGQFSMTTRRGGNDFHGTAYDYYQNAALNANTWTRNRLGEARPGLISNRYGGSVGGPIHKNKTFFFIDYEGYRFPQSQDGVKIGVSQTLRDGVIRFANSSGQVISYNLNPANGALASVCGSNGNQACDPRGIGFNPLVQQYMNTFYPIANDPSTGDGLNTAGIRAAVSTPIKTDFGLFRVDHNISSTWRLFAEVMDEQIHITDTTQLDFDPNVTKGKLLVSTSGTPQYPILGVAGLTGQITPNLVYDFRFGYNQQGFTFARQLPANLLPSAGTAIQLASGYLDDPGNDSNQTLGPEASLDKSWQWNNSFNLVRGSHVFGFGLMYQHINDYHFRTTSGSGSIGVPLAQITSGQFVSLPDTDRPPTCGSTTSANCITASEIPEWNSLYASLLGIWDNTQTYNPRGVNGQVLPGTTPLSYDQTAEHFEFTASDVWQIKPSLTLNYGLNVTYETPYRDINGKDYLIVNANTGKLIDPTQLLQQKATAAAEGQVYNVPMAYVHPSAVGGRGIYNPVFNAGPRAGLAWNPSYKDGLLGKLLGDHKTVIRGGYALVHDQILAIETELYGVLGNQLLATGNIVQAPTCDAHGTPGPNCIAGSSPYRIGIDGPAFEGPAVPFSLPYVPGSRNTLTGTGFGAGSTYGIDPNFHPGSIHSFNLTVQRLLPGNFTLQGGWIGRYGRDLSTSENVNAPPVLLKDMSGKSQQTFAQAFDAIANQLRKGVNPQNVTPQPWFENFFGAGSTASAAASGSALFTGAEVDGLVQDVIDPMLQAIGKPTIENQQFSQLSFQTSNGWMNYNAGFFSVRKSPSHGLTLMFNYTYSHCQDSGLQPSDSLGGGIDNPYNPNFYYGDCETDIRHVAQLYGRYEVPTIRSSSEFMRKLLGGWSTSYIYTAHSGLPLQIYAGDAFGGAAYGPYAGLDTAVATGSVPQTSLHYNTAGSNGVGTAGDPAAGGSGLNIFADPAAVFAQLRPVEISTDTHADRGLFRALGAWNLDLSIAKTTNLTERFKLNFTADLFNVFNHVNYITPGVGYYSGLSLNDPASFGVITADESTTAGQNVGVGPRRVQLGLRLEF